MKSQKILNEIRENGGLDLNHLRKSAKLDNTSIFEYTTNYIKNYWDCHGNTARKVANSILY